jgi:nicotinate phosphoribosyltransferase
MSDSLALLTDLYQLTMAYGYWQQGKAEQHAVFHLFYRRNPFAGGYAVAAGLQTVVEYLQNFRFLAEDVEYLAQIPGNDGKPIFSTPFLDYLQELRLSVDIDAIPEGTIVFPHQPLLRITGPILQCQLLETALLNIVNFQTLIATKASRVARVAGDEPVLEFGLRRAQGPDGAMSASRAAYIGGCAATSNVLAGKRYGIPVRGTHAHSWVMSFDDELEAFEAYATAMPNNCVFLVDTYDTLKGVRNAIEVGKRLRTQGYRMVGIRLDSGDLAYLSIEARKLLDEAGFADAAIVASNDLDERLIESLKQQGAKITIWGVGTKLVTAYDQAALGGVYKLGAIRDENGVWQPKIKLSEQMIKTSNPGIQQVRRFYDSQGEAVADMLFDESAPPAGQGVMMEQGDFPKRRSFDASLNYEHLVKPVLRSGEQVETLPSLVAVRNRALDQVKRFTKSILRFDNPHIYPCGLEESLYQVKARLIRQGSAAEST